MLKIFFRPWAVLVCLGSLSSLIAQPFSCDPIVTFADGKTPLREIFVSPSGKDSSGDGSQENPFTSLDRALQGVEPGDAIRLLPGMHPAGQYLSNLSGTAEAPIWIGGLPGEERPVISGGNQAMQLVRVRYLILENLEITGAEQNGINCDDGTEYANPDATRHVIFRNLYLHDIGTGGNQDALKLSGVDDFFVLDCEFANASAGGSGIDHVGCHSGLIARNDFTDMGSNAIQCKGGSEDIEIRWNRFINGGQRAVNIGGSTGFQFFRPPLSETEPNAEARNIRVLANLFVGSATPVAYVGTVDSLVANNTIVDPGNWILRILQETTSTETYEFLPSGNNAFINNLVSFERGEISTYVNIGGNTDPGSFTFANNLWHARDNPSQSQPSLPSAESRGLYGQAPQFMDAAGADYRLMEPSPAAGAGMNLEEVTADLLERCFASPPSIGAYEADPVPTDTDGDQMPDAWEEDNGLDRLDSEDAALDGDEDGMSNRDEYLAGTDPQNAVSLLRMDLPRREGDVLMFNYDTVPGRIYRVEHREAFDEGMWLMNPGTLGTGGVQAFQESVSVVPARFYRMHVELAD